MDRTFAVRNEADEEAAELLIYDRIGKDTGTGIDAKDVKAALDDIPKDREILTRINSPGGNLWDGLAIYAMLSERRDHVTCQVDGVAASSASIIAIAGKCTVMPTNGLMMIHLPRIPAFGDATELRREADKLDKHTNSLTAIYARKTGRPVPEILAKMEAETWFTGEDALEFGLCDRVTEEEQAITAMATGFDFSKFTNVPEALQLHGAAVLLDSGFYDKSKEEDEAALERIYGLLASIERLKQWESERRLRQ